MGNLAIKVIDRLFIVVYGSDPPTDEEWSTYLALSAHHGIEETMQLIVSDGGAPTRAQSSQLQELMGNRTVPVAVVSGNVRVRGTVTLLSWFNRKIKAFTPAEVKDALDYLEIPHSRAELILAEVVRLRGILAQGRRASA